MSRGRLFFSVRLERLADNAYVVDRVHERAVSTGEEMHENGRLGNAKRRIGF